MSVTNLRFGYIRDMADVHNPATRSYNMSRIGSKDTHPELVVRKYLFSQGYRYKLHASNLPGKPDIVLPKFRTVIVVNGCFWHGHNDCKYFKLPQTRKEFWEKKISDTKKRDLSNYRKLQQLGWHTIKIFECQLAKSKRDKTLQSIKEQLQLKYKENA